jgi:putative membrane protein insertion efficiency factor
MKRALIAAVRGYQYAIRPMLGANCRFYPSCSDYAREALEQHGAMRGSWLAAKRLCKCHPFHPGGVDLVPTSDR